MSSLTRAFTTRKNRIAQDGGDHPKVPQRSISTRDHRSQVQRHQISAPVELVHTTNMLSYNAPDLPRKLRSKASDQSSIGSEPSTTAESTPPTSPEVSPVEECPGPVPNHLSTYFMIPEKAQTALSKVEPPVIPQRSPSHTKQRSYDAIARHQSLSRMSKDSDRSISTKASFSFSRSSSTSTRASSTSSTTTPQNQKQVLPPLPTPAPQPASLPQRTYKDSHPFGKELAQVTELAEEYSAKLNDKADDEDDVYIKSHGLVKFSASDYLSDVQTLLSQFYPEVAHARQTTPIWI